MARRLFNNFINLSKSRIVHQDLQPSRIKHNLNDVQSVVDLLKYTFINPAEESSLISLSSGIIPTEAIRRDLENVYDKGKSAMDTFIDLRLVNMSKSIYDPLKKLRLGNFTNRNKKVKVKVKGREVQFSSQSEIFGKIALIVQSISADLQEITRWGQFHKHLQIVWELRSSQKRQICWQN